MSVEWKCKRGNSASNVVYTGPAGELTVNTETNRILIHDGVTLGGTRCLNPEDAVKYAGVPPSYPISEENESAYMPELPGTASFSYIPIDNTTYSRGYTAAVLAPNGDIFFIPGTASRVGIYSPSTESFRYIEQDLSTIPTQDANDYKWSGGVLAPNGFIYCVPYAANFAIKISTDGSDEVTTIIDPSQPSGWSNPTKWGPPVLLNDTTIVAAPYWEPNAFKLDITTETYGRFGTYYGFGGNKWFGGCLGPDGNAYFAAAGATTFLRITGDEVTEIIGSDTDTTWNKYMTACVTPEGNILFAGSRVKRHQVYRLDQDTFRTIETPISESLSPHFHGCITGVDGYIYIIPNLVSTLVRLDTSSYTYEEFDISNILPGNAQIHGHGAIQDRTGAIYVVPDRNKSEISIITPNTSYSGADWWGLHPKVNHC